MGGLGRTGCGTRKEDHEARDRGRCRYCQRLGAVAGDRPPAWLACASFGIPYVQRTEQHHARLTIRRGCDPTGGVSFLHWQDHRHPCKGHLRDDSLALPRVWSHVDYRELENVTNTLQVSSQASAPRRDKRQPAWRMNQRRKSAVHIWTAAWRCAE